MMGLVEQPRLGFSYLFGHRFGVSCACFLPFCQRGFVLGVDWACISVILSLYVRPIFSTAYKHGEKVPVSCLCQ